MHSTASWGAKAAPNPKDAAQFMPFAALTGFEEMASAQEQTHEPRRTLTEERAEQVSRMLVRLQKGDTAQVTHYAYGNYQTSAGIVRQVDSTFRRLVLVGQNGKPDQRILFEDIWDLRLL